MILPDHVHWILRPQDGMRFSDIVATVKRNVSWRLKELGVRGPLWQRRFYDHVIRDENDLARHLDYVHFNPVKHGYVKRPADHLPSSFAEWVQRGVYISDWRALEPDRIKGMSLG